jgi:SOS-response transcriptional repressor LexA
MASAELEPAGRNQKEEKSVESQGDRILKLLLTRGVPQRKMRPLLKKVTKASYQSASNWLSGDTGEIGSDYLEAIAAQWGARFEWLATGRGEMDESDGMNFTNAQRVVDDVRRIPVLNYVQAGNPTHAIDDYMTGDGMAEIVLDAMTSQELSMESFALVIRGNSMEPEFKDGDIVVIDPSVKPDPGDCVVAKLDKDDETTFKKYRSRGMDAAGHHVFELVPLNEDYHTITVSSDNPGHIIGTMMEHRKKRRR